MGQLFFINVRQSNEISLLIFILYGTKKYLKYEMSRKIVLIEVHEQNNEIKCSVSMTL